MSEVEAHRPLAVVGISGSPSRPSKTTALVDSVVTAFAARLEATATVIELAPLLGELAAGPDRNGLGSRAQHALAQAEQADLLVVGSPAYRASFTGVFKLFFDHIGQYALVDKPVVLTATGGSDRHALVVEHQMRPLFGFFQSLTLPLGIFANAGDFDATGISSPALHGRIDAAVQRTAPMLTSHLHPHPTLAEVGRPDTF